MNGKIDMDLCFQILNVMLALVLEEEELGITVLISQFWRADTEDVTFFSGMGEISRNSSKGSTKFHRHEQSTEGVGATPLLQTLHW
jgi:hypothetical protein